MWTIFSIIGVQIKNELSLNDTEFGLLVGTPILTGALTRLALGIWTDQYGGRLVQTVVMLSSAVATFLLASAASYPQMLVAALGVGIAGGSFAVGVAYLSRWYPTEKQGTALGLFGLGNVGAAITHFMAPFVMVAFGWTVVAQVWAAALAALAIAFWLIARDDPATIARRAGGAPAASLAKRLAPLKKLQVWRFSLYYFFTFGAFVALALWLPRYYVGVYGLSIETAGLMVTAFSLAGSVFRAVGGWLSDKYGARTVMYVSLMAAVVVTFIISYPETEYIVHGAQGGNLGQLTRGDTTPEFEAALVALPVGAISSEPVATRYGLHIIRLERRIEERQLPFELVADRIADYLRESVLRRATAQYIARLVSRATITGVTLDGAEAHRVN